MILLKIIIVCFTFVCACAYNFTSIPSTLVRVDFMVISQVFNNSQSMIYQNALTKTWYSGFATSPSVISYLDSSGLKKIIIYQVDKIFFISSDTFISLHYFSKNASKILMNLNLEIILDFSFSKGQPSQYKLIAISSTTIIMKIKQENNDLTISSSNLTLNASGERIQCLRSSSVCISLLRNERNPLLAVIDTSSTISYVSDFSLNELADSISNFRLRLVNDSMYVYVTGDSGTLYELMLIEDNLILQRVMKLHQGKSPYSLVISLDANYLLVTDGTASVSYTDLTSGLVLSYTDVSQALTNLSNLKLDVAINDNQTYFFYNSNNDILYAEETSLNDGTQANSSQLYCLRMMYFNQTNQTCLPCSSNCTSCDPLTGHCITCQREYFNKQGTCLSCYYEEDGYKQFIGECFSQLQQIAIKNSFTIVEVLSKILTFTYSMLSACALLFLFFQTINFWNLTSMCYFLQIKKPFFLENFLKKIFTSMNGSVFETLKIRIPLSFNTSDISDNDYLSQISSSTDYLEFSGQNLLMFFYSVFIILVFYRSLNWLLLKCSIKSLDIFSYESIFEQFVLSFTVSMIPFHYFITSYSFSAFNYKLNAALYLITAAFIIVIPLMYFVCFTSLKIKNAKVQSVILSTRMVQLEQVLGERSTHKIAEYISIETKDKFLYSLLSFASAFLIGIAPSKLLYFIIPVALIHTLSLINILKGFKCTLWRVNSFIQKILLATFHSLVVSLIYVDDLAIQFHLSVAIIILILVGGLHQIITVLLEKAWFFCILFKNKCEETDNIERFLKKNDQDSCKFKPGKKRQHAIKMKLAKSLPHIKSNKKVHFPDQQEIFKTFHFPTYSIKVLKEREPINVSRAEPQQIKKNKEITQNLINFALNRKEPKKVYNIFEPENVIVKIQRFKCSKKEIKIDPEQKRQNEKKPRRKRGGDNFSKNLFFSKEDQKG